MLVGRYKVRLRDTAGVLVAEFDDWRSLQFKHVVNGPSSCVFVMNGLDPRVALFEPNCQIEILRRVPDPVNPVAWYTEWEGLHETGTTQVYTNGDRAFTSYGVGYLAFLQRRSILWYAGSAQGTKAAIPSDTAMYEYVDENAGPGATVAAGRLYEGVTTGLILVPPPGTGVNWDGGRAYRNLLEVLQEIANFSQIDYSVVNTGPAAWQFQVFPDQLGEDRTTAGLDPSTGLNAAGNPPVIFSLEAGNVASLTFTQSQAGSANVVAALGQSSNTARNVQVRTNEAARTLSPDRLNQREICRNASTQATDASLQAYADEVLEKLQPAESLTFVPLQVASTIYGLHYWQGDRLTVRFDGVDYDKRLVGVTISVKAPNGEEFRSWKFEDVPRV